MSTNNSCNYVPINHDTLVGATLGQITNVSTGTIGQVLTSNGASADPSYQTLSVPFSPNSTISVFDDFMFSAPAVTGFITGQLDWDTSTSNAMLPTSPIDNGHPGILRNPAIITGASYLMANATNAAYSVILGGGSITINWVFKIVNLSAASPRYILRVGIGDVPTTDQNNGTYFEYSDNINSGNWVIKTASSASRTTTNSATAVTAAWHNAQITINAAATSIAFTMDGVSLGTIATNIPATPVSAFINIVEVSGTVASASILIDLMYYTQTLTSAR